MEKTFTRFLLLTLLVLALPAIGSAQDKADEPETFAYEEDGITYQMQKYFLVFLKKGPTRNQSTEDQQKIQGEHLAYLGNLYEEGWISLNGPSEQNALDIQGFTVYNTATIEQARAFAEGDPAVKAGRLVVEVYPWWAAKGSTLK